MSVDVSDLRLDRVTEEFLRRSSDPQGPLSSLMEQITLPPALAAAGDRILSRPLFAPEEHVTRAAADTVELFGLLTSLPDRLFDGDVHAYCRALGIDARKERLITRFGGAAPPMYGRTDMNYDGSAFQLLEFNIASEIGGVDRAGTVPALLARAAAFRPFAAEHALAYVDTGRIVADTLWTQARTVLDGDRTPVVALLEGPGGLARFGAVWEAVAELMRGYGLDFRVGEVNAVRARGERVVLDGTPLDVVLRCFSAEELLAEPDGEALAEPVFRAHEAGTAVLWTPMESNLFSNKSCLALLSRPGTRARFTPDELALIDRVLPWTRTLPHAPLTGAPDLVDECLTRRHELILKPNARYGGRGVLPGWECTEGEWRAAIEAVDGAGAVVQQRVRPRPEPVADPLTGESEEWRAVWGIFLTPQGHAGTYARAVPASEGAVVGMGASRRARTAGVFTYGEGAAERGPMRHDDRRVEPHLGLAS